MSDERARQLGVRGDFPSHAGIGQTFAGRRLVGGITALAGERIAIDVLTGMAARRSGTSLA